MINRASMEAALRPFGWACGPEFWQRYHSDTWVFHLANAVEQQAREIERLRAENAVLRDKVPRPLVDNAEPLDWEIPERGADRAYGDRPSAWG